MGTTLTGTTPQDTYDSLIKVTDNGPLSGTAKYLSDGLGNDSVLALSTSAVGIGTASPTVGRLQVKGTGSTDATTAIFTDNSSGAATFAVRDNGNVFILGNVGIGTSSPASYSKLQVKVGTDFNLAIGQDTGALGLGAYNDALSANADLNITGANIKFSSGGERMRITSAGNVGIGTSSPLSLLDIENSNGSTITLGTNQAAGSIASKKFTTLNFNGFNNTTMAQIQSWDESASTGYGYLTLSTFTGSVLTEKVRILSSGGITFNGDTAAANALDDYEEGTFTPAFVLGGGSVTYTNQTGTYTKIGRLVTIQMRIEVNVATSPSGALEVTSLPFTVSTGNKGAISTWATDMNAASKVWVGIATPSTNNLRIYTYDAGSVSNPAVDLQNGCVLNITATYEV